MSTPPASARGRWLTRANALTAVRFAAIPLLAHALLVGAHGVALWVFVLAVASDLLDGWLARRFAEASSLGGFLDHLADALFVVSALAALAWRDAVPGLLPPLVALAFTQYTLDSRALAGRPLRASSLGRWNGIAYFVLVGIPVVRDGLGLGWPPRGLVHGLGLLLVASTALSMLDRAAAHFRR